MTEFDASNLLELMKQCKDQDAEFFMEYCLDPLGTNSLEGICWAFPFMANRARLVGLNVLIFDTTHQTNKFGAYLCFMCIENELGESEILFFALIKHQVGRWGDIRIIDYNDIANNLLTADY